MSRLFCIVLCVKAYATLCGVFIVVHGTWATASTWNTPGGDFFDILERSAQEHGHKTINYSWSGYFDHTYRVNAGKALATLIRSYPPNTDFYIVAHSHGGNVAILASQELAKHDKKHHRIKLLYALGTPVDRTIYMPDMSVIDYFYNLFSFKDIVQPILGFFHRTYPPHDRIANIRIMINGKEPDHSTLHHPLLAHWIPNLHKMLLNHECSPVFAFHVPGIIDFFDMAKPRYTLDVEREALIAKDQSIQAHMLALFRKRFVKSVQIQPTELNLELEAPIDCPHAMNV